jgi:hypothetical protein
MPGNISNTESSPVKPGSSAAGPGIKHPKFWEEINAIGFTRKTKYPAAKREDILDAFHRAVGELKDELPFRGIMCVRKSLFRRARLGMKDALGVQRSGVQVCLDELNEAEPLDHVVPVGLENLAFPERLPEGYDQLVVEACELRRFAEEVADRPTDLLEVKEFTFSKELPKTPEQTLQMRLVETYLHVIGPAVFWEGGVQSELCAVGVRCEKWMTFKSAAEKQELLQPVLGRRFWLRRG